MLHFSLENDVWLCYNNCICGISSLVEHLLPKQDRRVRFPYPAPRTAADYMFAAALFIKPKQTPDADLRQALYFILQSPGVHGAYPALKTQNRSVPYRQREWRAQEAHTKTAQGAISKTDSEC